MFHFPETRMLRENRRLHTDKDPHTHHAGIRLLIWLVVFLIGTLAQSMIQLILFSVFPFLKANYSLMVQLFSTSATIVICFLYCRFIEKRNILSMGFSTKNALIEYFVGLGAGFVLLTLAVGLCLMTGKLTLTVTESPAVGATLLYLLGFLIQGMSEEILCRGCLMMSLAQGCPTWLGILINALIFTLLHMGNPGITPIALVNLTLFGLFASLYTLRRGSLWGIGALHAMWNFAQGNIFGIQVSGLTGCPSLLTATVSEDGSLIHGGAFGIEGGLAATFVLVVGMVVCLLMKTKKSEIAIKNDNPAE